MVSMAQSKKTKDSKGRIDDHFLLNLARLLPIIYLVALCIFCVAYDVFPGPDFLVLCFFIYAAFTKRAQRFIKDWIPFLALFFAYEAMRGFAYKITGIVHVTELISAEVRIFGTIPTLVLQHFYRSPILDWLGAFFYSLHFLIPTVFGFVLWHRSRENYQKYAIALLLSSYSALITILLYPSAPPWFGVQAERILFHIDHEMGIPFYATLFVLIEPNPFAAFPSLHATYPWLISLYSIKIKRIKALPILIIPLGVCFSAVYLGEHYVIDLLAGVAYSTAAFFLVEKLIPRFSFRFQYATYLYVFKNHLWFSPRDRRKPKIERPKTFQSLQSAKISYTGASSFVEKNVGCLGLTPTTLNSWCFVNRARMC